MKAGGFAIAIALILAADAVQGQQFDAGVKGGPNFATLSGSSVEDANTRTAFAVGGFVIYHINEMLALQPELFYTGKGARWNEEGVRVTGKLSYMEVPILARIGLGGQAGGVVPHVIAGPSLAFNTTCKLEGAAEGMTIEMDCDDLGLDIKTIDFGMVVGGGLMVPMGGLNLVLDGRYTLGFTDLFDAEDAKNRAFSAMAGISVPLGGRTTTAAR